MTNVTFFNNSKLKHFYCMLLENLYVLIKITCKPIKEIKTY